MGKIFSTENFKLPNSVSLAPNMFDNKKAPAHVTFYPETGAIREIGQTSDK